MNLFFITEARFLKNSKDQYFGEPSFGDDLWERYLTKFDQIFVIARVKKTTEINEFNKYIQIKNCNVSFLELPYYVGLSMFISNFPRLLSKIKKIVNKFDRCIFICRVPGVIGQITAHFLIKKGIKCNLEIVGDPWSVFSRGVVKHPFRIIIKWVMTFHLKYITSKSDAVLYVTKSYLQKRYIAKNANFVCTASNVSISNQLYREKEIIKGKQIKIISIGSLEQMYKGPEILLKAIKLLIRNGYDVHLTWIGDGKYLNKIKKSSIFYNLTNNIEFIGNIANHKVIKLLDQSDIYISSSRTEGLPKSIIEAMSVALPVVSTNVGGIPELINERLLVKKDSYKQIALKVIELINDNDFYKSQSLQNFQNSIFYENNNLMISRIAFYEHIIKSTLKCQNPL